MNTFGITIFISVIVFLIFIFFQIKFFLEVKHYRNLFNNFFDNKKENYSTFEKEVNGESIAQLKQVGIEGTDLNTLIEEINHYVAKTRGTTDFSVIQNKVERKLNMRYDQSVAKLAFPTYLGLMGTFLGVFIGILMFIGGFSSAGDITDESIKNLLFGVLVSMSTSLVGLFLTTINNAKAGESRKNIEEDKNDFFDFVQTELMPSLDVSMVLAITRLHQTVDKFEPAFNRVITNFQTTFNNCTNAFGKDFEKNVKAVAGAVDAMGKNMNKINENISLQQQLLSTLKSQELIKGMEKYIEAADHFVSITKSLDKFEEARRMMLAAAQEAINLQNTYSEALKVPREIAVRCNQILDRIKTFEENVNRVGGSLENRQILGNDIVETIREQINQIRKKDKIAIRYFETADGKLNDIFEEQTKLIEQLNTRYRNAIAGHIEGFEKMLADQKTELERRHKDFLEEMRIVVNVEEIDKDFSNLKKLNDILEQLKKITSDPIKAEDLNKKLRDIKDAIAKIEIGESKSSGKSYFGGWKKEEVKKTEKPKTEVKKEEVKKAEKPKTEVKKEEVKKTEKPKTEVKNEQKSKEDVKKDENKKAEVQNEEDQKKEGDSQEDENKEGGFWSSIFKRKKKK